MEEPSNEDPYIKFSEEVKISPAESNRKLRQMNYALWGLILFIAVWFYLLVAGLKSEVNKALPAPVCVDSVPANVTDWKSVLVDTNIVIAGPVTNLTRADIVNILHGKNSSTNVIYASKFEIGDVVEIRYFNIIGVIVEKVIGTDTYVVLYKNTEHTLFKIEIDSVMLFRPPAASLNPYSLMD